MRTLILLTLFAVAGICRAQDPGPYYDSLDKAMEKFRKKFTNDSSLTYTTAGEFGKGIAPKGIMYYSDTTLGWQDKMHGSVIMPACDTCRKFIMVELPDVFSWGSEKNGATIIGTLFGNTDGDKDNEIIMIYSQRSTPGYPAYNPGCQDYRFVKVFDQASDDKFIEDAAAGKKIMDALGNTVEKCNVTGKHKITDAFVKKKIQSITF